MLQKATCHWSAERHAAPTNTHVLQICLFTIKKFHFYSCMRFNHFAIRHLLKQRLSPASINSVWQPHPRPVKKKGHCESVPKRVTVSKGKPLASLAGAK